MDGKAALCCIAAAGCLYGLAGAATAEASADSGVQLAELKKLSIEELMNLEVKTVYSASKYSQNIADAPSSVTLVTADDIRKFGYRTLADILQSVRGIYVTYDRNYSYVGIRGFGRPGDYNTRVLLLVDGHAINDAIYDSAAIGLEFILDVDLIDRVEISRGPGSSLYGSNAFFGVINVITKTARYFDGAELAASAGRFNTATGRLSYGGAAPWGGSVLASASGWRSDGQEWRYREFSENNGLVRDADGERAQSAFGKATAGGVTLTAAAVSRRKEIPTAPWNTLFNTTETWSFDRHAYAEARFEHGLAPRTDLSARLSFDEYGYYGQYRYDYAAPGDPPFLVLNKDDAAGRWWTGEAQTRTRLTDRGALTLGLSTRANMRQFQMNYDDDPYYLYLRDERKSVVWAAFAQHEHRLTDRFLVNAGVRYDHYQSFGGTVNPRVAVIYQPDRESALKALYGRAFREPNVYERYYDDGGNAQKANPALNPERINTYEVVYERAGDNGLRGTVSAYYYRLSSLITLETDVDGLEVFRNTRDIIARGIEFEATKKTGAGWRGTVNYAYQEAEDSVTRTVLTNSPRHLAKAGVIVPFAGERYFAGIEGRYLSSRRTTGAPAAGAVVANATLFTPRLAEGAELSVSIYNVMNKRYADPASPEHMQDAIEQDGRTVRVKLTYLF